MMNSRVVSSQVIVSRENNDWSVERISSFFWESWFLLIFRAIWAAFLLGEISANFLYYLTRSLVCKEMLSWLKIDKFFFKNFSIWLRKSLQGTNLYKGNNCWMVEYNLVSLFFAFGSTIDIFFKIEFVTIYLWGLDRESGFFFAFSFHSVDDHLLFFGMSLGDSSMLTTWEADKDSISLVVVMHQRYDAIRVDSFHNSTQEGLVFKS